MPDSLSNIASSFKEYSSELYSGLKNKADYVPVASTFKSGYDLFSIAVAYARGKPAAMGKSLPRAAVGLVPVIGNVALAVHDVVKNKKRNKAGGMQRTQSVPNLREAAVIQDSVAPSASNSSKPVQRSKSLSDLTNESRLSETFETNLSAQKLLRFNTLLFEGFQALDNGELLKARDLFAEAEKNNPAFKITDKPYDDWNLELTKLCLEKGWDDHALYFYDRHKTAVENQQDTVVSSPLKRSASLSNLREGVSEDAGSVRRHSGTINNNLLIQADRHNFNIVIEHAIQAFENQDFDKAFELFQRAEHFSPTFKISDKLESTWALEIGKLCHENGWYDKALLFYHQAMVQGYLPDMTALTECYEKANPPQLQHAEYLKANAIDIVNAKILSHQGHPEASFALAVHCSNLNQPMVALNAINLAVDQGHIGAKVVLAECYRKGFLVDQDVEYALHLLNEAANQGDAGAKVILAEHYLHGIGIPQDRAYAVGLFAQAANQGNAVAIGVLKLMGVA